MLKAQTTAVLYNQKDGWGLEYTYIGEVTNGKANGMGVAKYSTGNVKRYVGNFANGFYSGKGVMLFSDGAFLAGNWSNGKLHGKGTNLTSDGALYIGDFANGVKNGQGILIYKNNSFVKGGFSNDKLSGRCINLWEKGNIISDVLYSNDARNGTGYQYEAASKTLYEGEWKEDKWVQAATASFTSFLKAESFTGESTSSHVLMGPVTPSGHLKDTSYYYDLAKHKRYFGYYVNGYIKNGLQIRDDSTRFIGEVDDIGAKGYCYDFKFNSYYSEGYFVNDLLDGEIIDIDLAKKTVYFGHAVAGEFTGKAYFFNDKNDMYSGDYLKGRFTGQGYHLESSGRCITGSWEDGLPQKVSTVITAKGNVISGSPKTFSEAMNIVVKDYTDYYDNISGGLNDDYLSDDDWLDKLADDNSYVDFYSSLTSFPGAVKKDIIATDFDSTNFYIATFLETDNAAQAKAKYIELGKQLLACTLNNSNLSKPTKLTGTVNIPDVSKDENITRFDLVTTASEYKTFHVWLQLIKNKDGKYIVSLEMGEKAEVED